MFLLLFFLSISNTSFNISTTNVLISCISDDDSIVVPARVVSIFPNAFANAVSSTLTFETNSQLTGIYPFAFNSSSFVTITFPSTFNATSDFLFNNSVNLKTVSYPGLVPEISLGMFFGCTSLTTLRINGVQVYYSGSLNFQRSRVTVVHRNAFDGVYLRSVILDVDIINPEDFTFGNQPGLQTVVINHPLTRFSSYMFVNCTALQTITVNRQVIYRYGELDLVSMKLSSADAVGVFEGVPVNRLIIDASVDYPRAFFDSLQGVTSIMYHGTISSPFGVPVVCKYFSQLSSISVRSYDIMRDQIIDLSHMNITSLANDAFTGIDAIAIDVPHTISSLPDDLFYNCSILQSVVIPISVSRIPPRTFEGCAQLNTLVINGYNLIDNGVLDFSESRIDYIGFRAFSGVSSIWKVVFDSVWQVMINGESFAFNDNLVEVEFLGQPNIYFTQTFGNSFPFREDINLTKITLPEGSLCSSLPNISFQSLFFHTPLETSQWKDCVSDDFDPAPSSPGYAYHPSDSRRLVNCTLVNDATLNVPSGVYYISGGAFNGCQVQTLNFASDSKLVHIDEGAFTGLKLRTVTFPSSYTKVNPRLFIGITTLESVKYNGDVNLIQAHAFNGCTGLATFSSSSVAIISNGILNLSTFSSLGPDAFLRVRFRQAILPAGLMAHVGFQENVNLLSVQFTDNVTFFPAYAFFNCTSLNSIVDASQTYLDFNGNLVLLYVTKVGYYAFAGTPIRKLSFSSRCVFHYEAFYGCPNLIDVECYSPMNLASFQIPPQIRAIPFSTFIYNAKTIISEDSLELNNIEITAFGAEALSNLQIRYASLPSTVTNLAAGLFDSCQRLEVVEIQNTPQYFPDQIFRNCISLRSILIAGNAVLSDGSFETRINGFGFESFYRVPIVVITFDGYNTTLGDYSFARNSNLSLIFFTHIQSLSVDEGASPFAETPNLRAANLYSVDNCSEIGHLSFYEVFRDSGLQNYSWSDFGCRDDPDYYYIARGALVWANTSQAYITLPSSISVVQNYAFQRCSSYSVSFEEGSNLRDVFPKAFDGSKVVEIHLPPSFYNLSAGFLMDNPYVQIVDIQGNCTYIPDNCFSGSYNIRYLSIGAALILDNGHLDFEFSQITSIGNGAFNGLKFTTVRIPTMINMPSHLSFANHNELIFVSLPVADRNINDRMFYRCTSLAFITIGQRPILAGRSLNLSGGIVNAVGQYAFSGVSINQIILPYSLSFDESSFADITGRISILFEASERFDLHVLRKVMAISNVISISLGNLVLVNDTHVDFSQTTFTYLPEEEFARTNYINITLSPTLLSLPDSLFESATKLQFVSIPSFIEFFPNRIFFNCAVLSTILFQEKVLLSNGVLDFTKVSITSVGKSAFSGCNKIRKIIFPSPISIHDQSFASISSLREIVFSSTNINVYDYPFNNSGPLDSATVAGDDCVDVTKFILGAILSDDGVGSCSSGLSKGAIAAIIIVVIVVIAVVAFLVFWFVIRPKRNPSYGMSNKSSSEANNEIFKGLT